MDDLPQLETTGLGKYMLRIVIFLFTLAIGMIVGLNQSHAATTPSPVPTTAPAKAPVPLVVGTVTDISATSVTIKDANGQTTSLTFAPNVRVEAPNITSIKGKLTVKNIAVSDTIAAVTADQTTTSVVIIGAKNGNLPAGHATFFGIVSSREATSSGTFLSMKSISGDQFAKALVSSITKVMAKGIDKPTIDDIKAGDKVLVAGILDKQSVITVAKAYLIPGEARALLQNHFMSESPVSTQSASPSAKTLFPKASSAASSSAYTP